jgi:hypothetical protein
MLAVQLNSIGEGIWEYSHDVRFWGLLLPHRMTVIRLSSGKLVLHSPTRCDEGTIDALRQIGTVAEIVAPNRFHDLFLKDWLTAIPEARLWIPPGMDRNLPQLPGIQLLSEASSIAPWQEEITCVPLDGLPTLNEFAVYHAASKAVIFADFLFNIEASSPFATRTVSRLGGFYQRLAVPLEIRLLLVRNRDALRKSVGHLLNLWIEKVIVGHGANILRDAKTEFGRAVQWLIGRRASESQTDSNPS